jgi:hypothetical protein
MITIKKTTFRGQKKYAVVEGIRVHFLNSNLNNARKKAVFFANYHGLAFKDIG